MISNQVEQNKMISLVKMTNDFFSQIEHFMLTWAFKLLRTTNHDELIKRKSGFYI